MNHPASFPAPVTPGPRTVLVYGQGEPAMTMLALGLAQRFAPRFAWGRCMGAADALSGMVRAMWLAHAGAPRFDSVSSSDLEPQPVPLAQLDAFVDPGPDTQRERLLSLLRLPPLFQALVGPPEAPTQERLPLLLSHVERIPPEVLRAVLTDPTFRRTLRESGVPIVATFDGMPDASLRDAFDRVFRIEDPGTLHWYAASVWTERGPTDTDRGRPRPLREVWTDLDLDPRLLGP